MSRSRRVLATLLLTAIVALAGGSLPALAHEVDPDIVVELDPVPEALAVDGLSIGIVNSIAPQMAVENLTDSIFEVLGDGDVPFLRITPEGVEANFDAGDWYLTNDPLGALAIPERARGDGLPPAWERIRVEPSWGWFDHRIHPREFDLTGEREVGQIIGEFSIAVTFGGEPAEVTGQLVVKPSTGFVTSALRSRLEAPNTDLSLLPGVAPGLFMDHQGEEEVIVLGEQGEPFLRFTQADGTQANLASPTWQETARVDPETIGLVVEGDQEAGADVPPDWVEVSRVPRFGWLDPRGLPEELEPPEGLRDAGVEVELGLWDVPVVIDGVEQVVSGSTRWEPIEDQTMSSGPPWSWIAVGAVVCLAAFGLLLARRHRSVGSTVV